MSCLEAHVYASETEQWEGMRLWWGIFLCNQRSKRCFIPLQPYHVRKIQQDHLYLSRLSHYPPLVAKSRIS